jgi:hypothetical protein
MDGGFWLGLALAIPIGLVTNLATPFAQRYLAGRSEKVRASRENQIKEERRIATELAGSAVTYIGYLHQSLIRLFIFVVLIVVIGTLPVYTDTEGSWFFFRQFVGGLEFLFFFPLVSTIAVTGLVIAFSNEIRKNRRIIRAVQEFEQARRHASDSDLPESDA